MGTTREPRRASGDEDEPGDECESSEQPETSPRAPLLDEDDPTEERDDLTWRRPLRPRPLHLWW